MSANDEKLRAQLAEDTGSMEEAEALLPIARQLAEWPAPTASKEDTARLLGVLEAALPERQSAWARWQQRLLEWWPGLLIRAQIRIVQREIWVASLLVMALGGMVTVILGRHVGGSSLPLVIVAPIVAAMGVAFLYGPDVDPALEITLATPISSRLILLARLALVMGFNFGLGLAACLVLVLLQPGLSLWPLLTAWLAPMAFLSSLAFLLSTLFVSPELSALLSLSLWILQALHSAAPSISRVILGWPLPNLMVPAAQPWLWLMALALGGLALWLGGEEDRWLRLWR